MANLKREKNVLELFANRRVAALAAKLLAVHGYACRPSSTFTQALTAIGGGEIQVALVDFGTEPDDGCRFAAEAKKIAPSVSVIVCDSEPSVAHAQKVGASEAFDYLPCPFVVSDLVACLGRASAVIGAMRKPRVALEAYIAAHGGETAAADGSAAGVAAAGDKAGAPDAYGHSPAREQLAASVDKLKSFAGEKSANAEGEQSDSKAESDENPRDRINVSPVAVTSAEMLLAGERALLSELLDREAIDSELAAKASERLTQAAASGEAVSAMAAIELLNEESWERAAAHVADRFKTAPVDLGVFPPDEKLIRGAADVDALKTWLAVPLAKLDGVTFVAQPHPSPAAQAEVAQAVGGNCRCFVCSALAAKAALERALAPKEESAAS